MNNNNISLRQNNTLIAPEQEQEELRNNVAGHPNSLNISEEIDDSKDNIIRNFQKVLDDLHNINRLKTTGDEFDLLLHLIQAIRNELDKFDLIKTYGAGKRKTRKGKRSSRS
jgi:hypothetical protein